MHFLNLRMQSMTFFIILICATVTIVNAGSRKVLNSTFVPVKSNIPVGNIPEARSSNSRVGQNYYDEDDISKEEKAVAAVGSGGAKKDVPTKIANQNPGESATARSCAGGGTTTATVTTPDWSALAGLASGASGIAEIIVAVVVILAIIWIKIIAAAVIIYWWIGAKGDKMSDNSGGYGYGPSKPVYGPPQPQYGTPSGYSSSRGLGSTFNLETLGNYVWKAIDFFAEMNDETNTENKKAVE